MAQPFWDTGSTTYASFTVGGNTDSLLPDVIAQNLLPERWAWDVIYMAGKRVPGLAEVKMKRASRVDKRGSNGSSGMAMTSLGYSPAEITIKIRLWTTQQLADLQSITIPSIQPHPGKSRVPKTIEVQYPSLSMWGVKSLYVVGIAGPEKTSTPQLWEVTFTCDELSPLVAVGSTKQIGGGTINDSNAVSGGGAGAGILARPSDRLNNPTPGS